MNLPELILNVELDTTGTTKKIAEVKSGDKAVRFISAKIMHNGELYMIPEDADVHVNMRKPDGQWIYNIAEQDQADHTVIFELTGQTLAVPGNLYGEIEVRSADQMQVFTTCLFTISIVESIKSEDAILSTDEMTALDNAFQVLDASHKSWSVAERVRELNEQLRVQAEDQRQLEEKKRQEAEVKRQEAAARMINDDKKSPSTTYSSDKIQDIICPELKGRGGKTVLFYPAQGYPMRAETHIYPQTGEKFTPESSSLHLKETDSCPSPWHPLHMHGVTSTTITHQNGVNKVTSTVQLPDECFAGVYSWDTGHYLSMMRLWKSDSMQIRETRYSPGKRCACIIFEKPADMCGSTAMGYCSVVNNVFSPHPVPEKGEDGEYLPQEQWKEETGDCPYVKFREDCIELWLPVTAIGNNDAAIRQWLEKTNASCPIEFCTEGRDAVIATIPNDFSLEYMDGLNEVSSDNGEVQVWGREALVETMERMNITTADIAYLMAVRRAETKTLSKYDPNSPDYVPLEEVK